MAMPTNRVVKHFDVVKDILACQLPGFIDFSFDAFALEQLKKAFCNGIVVTVASTAHTRLQIVGSQKRRPFIARKLTALVGMHHDTLLGLAPPYRSQQGLQNQVFAHARIHRPAHDLAREQVDNNRQIQPAFVCADTAFGQSGAALTNNQAPTAKIGTATILKYTTIN